MTKIFTSLLFSIFCFSSLVRAEGPLPVVPAPNQKVLLKSKDAKLAFNKRLVYDFWRVILIGRRLDTTAKFVREDYVQHNPNVETGRQGFIQYFSKLGGPQDIPATIPGLVSIQAEGDKVTLSFVNERESGNKKYTTTWFDMFRIQDGKIAEHWDCAVKKD
jgi:predicted SnoaL-like aldol condensation-catalyzing enzyme